MLNLVATLMALIVLGGPFGEATASGSADGDRLQVEFEVAVAGAPAAVVVHAVDPGQTQETLSLVDRGGGVWGGIANFEAMNLVAVFEVVYPDGEGDVSQPTTLLELGLDPALIGMGDVVDVQPDDGDRPLSATTRRWGWGAAALTAIALALVAVWAMGERVRGKHAAPRRAIRGAATTVPDETQST
jgi:hypothetical protein